MFPAYITYILYDESLVFPLKDELFYKPIDVFCVVLYTNKGCFNT